MSIGAQSARACIARFQKRTFTARLVDDAIVEAARDLSIQSLSKCKCDDCSGWHLTSRLGFGEG